MLRNTVPVHSFFKEGHGKYCFIVHQWSTSTGAPSSSHFQTRFVVMKIPAYGRLLEVVNKQCTPDKEISSGSNEKIFCTSIILVI